jgi:BUD22
MLFRIWEKKFGRNAHHKKKEEENNRAQTRKISDHTSKIPGSNNTRSRQGSSVTQGSSKNKKFSPVNHPVDLGWSTRNVGASIPSVVPATGALHPSWEAKRRLKEKQSIGIVASQGKKIKFS